MRRWLIIHQTLTKPAPQSGMAYHVYILSCASNTAIYIGSTGNLLQRMEQHRSGKGSVHTAKYRIRKLVHLETYETIQEARRREQLVKRWPRQWKNDLIAVENPEWRDLIGDVILLG